MLERNGFEAEVGASRKAWAERDAEGSMAAISDEMVRSIQVIGSIEEVREQLQERSDLGAQIPDAVRASRRPEAIRRHARSNDRVIVDAFGGQQP